MPFVEIQETLSQIRIMCSVEPITVNFHDRGPDCSALWIFDYDAMIVVTA